MTALASAALDPRAGTAKRRPTIKDVAALADSSHKTVSRVLNNEPNVRPEMRTRVLEAAAALDYRRNTAASSIRRRDQSTASIGLIVEDLASPFASRLTRAVQDYALKRHHLVLVGSSDGELDRERALVAEFSSRRVDGLLVVPSGADQSYLEAQRRRGTPVVFIDRPGRRINADAVVSEHEKGVRDAVRHLAGHGHTRIGYLGGCQSVYTAARRLAGYRAAMRELTGGSDERHVRIGLRRSGDAYQATLALLAQAPAPTALVCGNDLIATGVLRALQQRGVRDQVAVVGFDDLELAALLGPALTVVARDVVAIGQRATGLLFRRLQHPTDRTYERIAVPTTLIPHGSVAVPANFPVCPRETGKWSATTSGRRPGTSGSPGEDVRLQLPDYWLRTVRTCTC
jgi:LacI family transcriptional regulator